MPLAETGDLDKLISIVKLKTDTDDYGDVTNIVDEKIYEKLYAMQRTKISNDDDKEIASLESRTQFVIRHRHEKEPLITTDMTLIYFDYSNGDTPKKIYYKIDNFNFDTQFKEWDVINCHKTPES